MTEKRFTVVYNERSEMMQYVDNHKEEPNKWAIWNASKTAQKLNELSDENERLRKDCTALVYSNQKYRKKNELLKADLEYFNTAYEVEERGLNVTPEMCTISSPIPNRKELFKENKQLKDENKELKEQLDSVTQLIGKADWKGVMDTLNGLVE